MSLFDKLFKLKRSFETDTHSSSGTSKTNPKTASLIDIKSTKKVPVYSFNSGEELTAHAKVDDKYIAVDGSSETIYRDIRELSDTKKQALDQSTLSLRTS